MDNIDLNNLKWGDTPPEEHNPEKEELPPVKRGRKKKVKQENDITNPYYAECLEKLTLSNDSYEDVIEELNFQKKFYTDLLSDAEGQNADDADTKEVLETIQIGVNIIDYQLGLMNDPKTREWYKKLAYESVEKKIGKENVIKVAEALDLLSQATEVSGKAYNELTGYIMNNTSLFFPELKDNPNVTLGETVQTLN